MPDVKTPNEEKQIKTSEQFNDDFKRHLIKIGWTDPKIQNKFIALVNSFILSGTSPSAQRVINNYLDKGLDVLNIELKRIEISKDNKIVQVQPDEVDNDDQDPQTQVETISREKFNSIIKEGRAKRLSKVNIFKNEISDLKKKRQVAQKLLSEGTDNLDKKLTEVINLALKKNIILEQGSVNSNNFRVFFKNYLSDDKGWSGDVIESLATGILESVEKSAGNINAQNKLVKETDLIIERISKSVEIKTAGQTKNSKIAFNELATLSSKLRGWSSEFFSEFMENILKIIGSSKSNKVQRYVANKVKDLPSKLPSDKKDDEKEDKSNQKDTEDNSGDKDQNSSRSKEQ